MRSFIKYKDDYLVSDHGEIWKITKNGLKLKKQHVSNNGYLTTSINHKTAYVHRIVMEAFKGKSTLTVDHLDNNKRNNFLYNLEYVTRSENVKRQHKDGLNKASINARLAHNKKVEWNGKVFESATKLSFHLGLTRNAVCQSIRTGAKVKGNYAKYI